MAFNDDLKGLKGSKARRDDTGDWKNFTIGILA